MNTHGIVPLLAQTSLFELLSQGGWAMYPLGALSAALFGFIIHSWIQTSAANFGTRPSRWIRHTLRDQIRRTALSAKGGADANNGSDRLSAAVQSIESNALRAIQYLNVIATVSPMVGLLGTVSGMIGAFQTIATGGMGKPELLAGDIGEALITTATGLTIGIPAMIFYFVLRNRLDQRLEELIQWLESEQQQMQPINGGGPDRSPEGLVAAQEARA